MLTPERRRQGEEVGDEREAVGWEMKRRGRRECEAARKEERGEGGQGWEGEERGRQCEEERGKEGKSRDGR